MENTPLTLGGKTVFDAMDFISSNVMLPLGGMLIVIFLGWKLGKTQFFDEVTNEGALKSPLKAIIYFIVKYLAPLAILVVFISGLIK